jgi:hypothetical protein
LSEISDRRARRTAIFTPFHPLATDSPDGLDDEAST